MSPEQLDALLIDHALGETRGDIAALIDAYVAKDPPARAALNRWQNLTTAARRALQQTGATVPLLPPFPRGRLQRESRPGRWASLCFAAAGMSACVLLGFLLGTRGTLNVQPMPAQISVTSPTHSAIPTNLSSVPDFWSMPRVRDLVLRAQRPTTPPDSPWAAHARAQFFGGQP